MSKLSEKLNTTIKTLEQAKLTKFNQQAAADMAKITAERHALQTYLDGIKLAITDAIEQDKVPAIRENDYTKQTMWSQVAGALVLHTHTQQPLVHEDIWNNFARWLKIEDLELVIHNEHDGVGVHSWVVISVVPVPKLNPRSV